MRLHPMRLLSVALLSAFVSTSMTPASAFALKPQETKEAAGLEELDRALTGDPDAARGLATRVASAIGVTPAVPSSAAPLSTSGLEEAAEGKAVIVGPPVTPQEQKTLAQWADHIVGTAFHENRVFGITRLDSAPPENLDEELAAKAEKEKRPDNVSRFITGVWAPARAQRELEPVLPTEMQAAKRDLRQSWNLLLQAVERVEDTTVRDRLLGQTRFALILEPALPNTAETDFAEQVMGFRPKVHTYYGLASPALYNEGDLNSDAHKAVVAVAGSFPYEVDGKAVEQPRSIYLSVARLKRYAQMVEQDWNPQQVLDLLAAYLAHLDADLLAGRHQPFTPPVQPQEDEPTVEERALALWKYDVAAQPDLWRKKDANRVTETFVSVNLTRVLGQFSEIPVALSQAAEGVLETAKILGQIKDHFVLRLGGHLLFDVSHQKGKDSPEVRKIIEEAVRAAVLGGFHAGLHAPEITGPGLLEQEGVNLRERVDWHEADWRYTERASQPTLRQVIVGGSPKASDGILFDLYASPNITTQQAIEGTHGTYYVVENTDDPSKQLGFTLPGGVTNKGLFDLLAVGKTSNHATRAIFTGKGGRAPLDEPAAAAFSLGDIQLVVYNSQAGWEAIGGITGPGTAPRIVDGKDRRLSLRPITHEQAATLTPAKLNGELSGYAPTVWWGTQGFNNGEFDEIVDPIQGPEFASTQLNDIRNEFARILLGQGEAQPFLKTETANARAAVAYAGFTARELKRAKEQEVGTLTTGVFKADIGSSLGHTGPLEVFMATTRAVLEEAKRSGLIQDYLVKHHRHAVDRVTEFRVGDDIELHITHKRPIGDLEIHRLAWRAFWAAGWVASDVLGRKPYGLMQDLPNAKDLDAWVESAMTPTTRDLILENLRSLSEQDPRAIDAAELKSVESEWNKEYEAQTAGTRQKKVVSAKAIGFTGNVKGSGIGSAEGYITPGAWSILAFDKASPGAFSVPYMRAAEAALAAGVYTNLLFEVEKVRPEYDADGKEIPQPPIILDYANPDERKLIQAMLGAVNEFQIKAIRTRDAAGVMRLVAVNSTDRLYQVTAGVYAGKDDPAAVVEAKFASFVFQWMQKELFITEGDERGSHWAFVLPVPMDRSSPGTHSIPVAVGLNFTVTGSGAVKGVEDVFDNLAYDPIRSKAAYYNWVFIRAVGNFGPRGDAASVEPTYPLWINVARITAPNSPYSVKAQAAPAAAGLEEAPGVVEPRAEVSAAEALAREAATSAEADIFAIQRINAQNQLGRAQAEARLPAAQGLQGPEDSPPLLVPNDDIPAAGLEEPTTADVEERAAPARLTALPILAFDPAAGAALQQAGYQVTVVVPTPTDYGHQLQLGVPADWQLGLLWGGLVEGDYLSIDRRIGGMISADLSFSGWQEAVVLMVSQQSGRRPTVVHDAGTLASSLQTLGIPGSAVDQILEIRARVQAELNQMA